MTLSRRSLDDNDEHPTRSLDEQLRQMIYEAGKYQDGSKEQFKIVHQMIVKMQQSGELPGVNTLGELGKEAFQETLKWFSRNFRRFDPQKAKNPLNTTVSGWVRHYFDITMRHLSKKSSLLGVPSSPFKTSPLDFIGPDGDLVSLVDIRPFEPELNPFVQKIQEPLLEIENQEAQMELSATLHRAITCCKASLSSVQVADHPEINCYSLLRRLLPSIDKESSTLIPGHSWEELEKEFKVDKKQLMNCFNRGLKSRKCKNCLRQHIPEDYGGFL